jgi:hypothetical protein
MIILQFSNFKISWPVKIGFCGPWGRTGATDPMDCRWGAPANFAMDNAEDKSKSVPEANRMRLRPQIPKKWDVEALAIIDNGFG